MSSPALFFASITASQVRANVPSRAHQKDVPWIWQHQNTLLDCPRPGGQPKRSLLSKVHIGRNIHTHSLRTAPQCTLHSTQQQLKQRTCQHFGFIISTSYTHVLASFSLGHTSTAFLRVRSLNTRRTTWSCLRRVWPLIAEECDVYSLLSDVYLLLLLDLFNRQLSSRTRSAQCSTQRCLPPILKSR